MEIIIEKIVEYKYVFVFALSILFLILILLIVLKPKKVKPIEKTIDDEKEEKTDIEKVIEALEENKEGRTMTTFEEEQEANAIISYQELVKAVQEKKLQGIEPIKKNEVEVKEEEIIVSESEPEIEIVESDEEENKTKEKEETKFKNSEFISPVFGKDSNNDKFLKDLKDFRSNL